MEPGKTLASGGGEGGNHLPKEKRFPFQKRDIKEEKRCRSSKKKKRFKRVIVQRRRKYDAGPL